MGRARVVLAAAAGYLVGTFPTAVLAATLAGHSAGELRETGSGNPGGLHVAKTVGTGWGAAVTTIDVGKGALAAELGRALAGPTGADVAGSASVIGHCFPVWTGLRGGKGVGTSGGQVMATFPLFVPLDLAVAGVVVKLWPGPRRTIVSMVASSSVWVVTSLLAWRRGWPTGRGRAGASLPFSAAVSGAAVVGKMLAGAKRAVVVARP